MTNMSISIFNRLKDLAREQEVSPDFVRIRYINECIIRRLAHSEWCDKFALKGGMMLPVWNNGEMFRHTADVDFTGLFEGTTEDLKQMLRDLAAMTPASDGGVLPFDDGIAILADSIKVKRENEGHIGGGKLTYSVKLHTAIVRGMQIDASFGAKIVPALSFAEYPSMFRDAKKNALPAPSLHMYPPEMAVAEKLHAMAQYGSYNGRIRDYYDLFVLLDRFEFDDAVQAEAIRTTFQKQRRPIPASFVCLEEEYATDPANIAKWKQLNQTTSFRNDPPDLLSVVERIKGGFGPAIEMARSEEASGPAPGC